MSEDDISWERKLGAIERIVGFRPIQTTVIILIGLITAVLEGIGISFVLPIIEIAQHPGSPAGEAGGILAGFVLVYRTLGIPFRLEFVILGVTAVMTVRYVAGFLNIWLREILRQEYVRHLQKQAFERALHAKVAYFDRQGSDEILNAIVTQAVYAGRVIRTGVQLIEKTFLAAVVVLIALVLTPELTILAALGLGTLLVLFRYAVGSGYSVGDRVAEANERIQESVQAGTQGIRDVKAYGLTDELFSNFSAALETYVSDSVKIQRNQGALNQFYQLAAASVLFLLIYLSITVASLTLAALGLFLFLMFRLAPILSTFSDRFYKLESTLPHLVRTQQFIEELEANPEPTGGTTSVPDRIERIEFDGVDFSYDDEKVLRDLSFEVGGGEFIGFVGQSGAGKSTIASLLSRMYEPDSGIIRVNGIPIHEFDVDEWRSRVAYVPQRLFIFNDTLRYNLTIGNRDVTDNDLDRICEFVRIDEFLDELSNGYDTVLGEDGVQLSSGQRQRVALARALLKDADILLLDEPTSHLDSNLEEEIQRGIESMRGEYTTITIAHRLSMVVDANRIYMLEDGEIVEMGDHGELVDDSGKYAELYEIQTQQA